MPQLPATLPRRADLRRCRIAALIVFLALPLLHYGALEALYQRIHNDIAFAAFDMVLSYWLQIIGDLFPCFGLAVLTVTLCRARRDRTVMLLSYIGTALPYLCMLVALLIMDPDFWANLGQYLLYLLFPFAEDMLMLTLVIFLCLLLCRLPEERDRLHTVQWLTAVLLLFRALIPEVVATVRFVHEMLYEYYDVITGADVLEIVLNYLYRIAIAAASYGIMRLAEWLLTVKNRNITLPPRAEKVG